jgi:hypothetical protein
MAFVQGPTALHLRRLVARDVLRAASLTFGRAVVSKMRRRPALARTEMVRWA